MNTSSVGSGCRICDGGTTRKVCDERRSTIVWAARRAAAAVAQIHRTTSGDQT